jgi:MerR family transcriptional regulator, light-induced transcriptional regulator
MKSENTAELLDEVYPIRTVSTMTGVNPITLRAWERRYGLIAPRRTETRHRLYSRADIDLINRVVSLLDKGMSIGQVRQVLHSEGVRSASGPGEETGPWLRSQEKMIAAISRFDEGYLEDTYNEALALYPIEVVTRQLLVPLLENLGERWRNAQGSIAEEHFFSLYLRNKIGARFHHRNRQPLGCCLLGACLPGEQHEIGLLLFALAAHDRGYRLVLLGSNMPIAELPAAAGRARAAAIVLSGSIDPPATLLQYELPDLVRHAQLPIFMGGKTSIRYRDAVLGAGAIPVGDDLGQGIKLITRQLQPSVILGD